MRKTKGDGLAINRKNKLLGGFHTPGALYALSHLRGASAIATVIISIG